MNPIGDTQSLPPTLSTVRPVCIERSNPLSALCEEKPKGACCTKPGGSRPAPVYRHRQRPAELALVPETLAYIGLGCLQMKWDRKAGIFWTEHMLMCHHALD